MVQNYVLYRSRILQILNLIVILFSTIFSLSTFAFFINAHIRVAYLKRAPSKTLASQYNQSWRCNELIMLRVKRYSSICPCEHILSAVLTALPLKCHVLVDNTSSRDYSGVLYRSRVLVKKCCCSEHVGHAQVLMNDLNSILWQFPLSQYAYELE